MNKNDFYRSIAYLNEAQNMDEVLEEFPYFQTARLLNLKHLSNTENIHFDKELRKTAAYASNRKVLYYLIVQKAIAEKAVEIDAEITEEINQEVTASPTISETARETTESVETTEKVEEVKSEPSPLDELILEGAINATIEKDVEEITQEEHIDSEEIEDKEVTETEEIDISNLSFTEWLKYSTGQLDTQPQQKSIESIIDNFIQSEPKISKPKAEFFSPTELARKSVEDNEDIVTETLANIYLAQGNYAKAIKAFERLSLNYPEKSTYFAARIKSTQDLMDEKQKEN